VAVRDDSGAHAVGTSCFSNSSHFPLRTVVELHKPVALPRGAPGFRQSPPTGSTADVNTIGIRLWLLAAMGAWSPTSGNYDVGA
jgi:hypothetical protein